jgi:hypothetical protein
MKEDTIINTLISRVALLCMSPSLTLKIYIHLWKSDFGIGLIEHIRWGCETLIFRFMLIGCCSIHSHRKGLSNIFMSLFVFVFQVLTNMSLFVRMGLLLTCNSRSWWRWDLLSLHFLFVCSVCILVLFLFN